MIRDRTIANRTRASRPRRIGALFAAALMASTGVAMAQQSADQSAPPPPPATKGADGGPQLAQPRQGPRFMADGEWGGRRGHHRGPGWRHRQGPGMMSPAKIAGALSVVETGIGIKPDQMDAWRSFTGAMIAFAEASQPPFMDRPGRDGVRMMPNADGSRAGSSPAQDDDPSASDEAGEPPMATEARPGAATPGDVKDRAFRFLDRMADRAIERGEKAKALKSAIDGLKGVLTDEQVTTARGLVRSMMMEAHQRHHGDRGRHGGWRHHGWDRGDRGDDMGRRHMGRDQMGPGDGMGWGNPRHHGMGSGPQDPDDGNDSGPDNG
ncbi:hypothetical protein [Aurantimonas sp. VKM B-3413]|uniref:hypothetical protein n=1 Tax=Aurantimonas sp. VKM B-3413 TaxID=2779401 RepID=UPI001E312271|nr:hypothetical protein [Aurantimonas sp. VKM B-3413]MCB8838793.1 hypothetical protein [Aurantimonas sp. VKM B-3413]